MAEATEASGSGAYEPVPSNAGRRYDPAPQQLFRWWQEVLFFVPLVGWWYGYRRRYWVSLDDH